MLSMPATCKHCRTLSAASVCTERLGLRTSMVSEYYAWPSTGAPQSLLRLQTSWKAATKSVYTCVAIGYAVRVAAHLWIH